MFSTLLNNPVLFVIFIIALLIAITIHEFAHAWTADRLGDPTPRLQGRISLNPFVHLDLMGMLFLFFVGFGWGKPVIFDPFNLKNPRKDAALISLAGPCSNIILALILALIIKLFIFFKLFYATTISLPILSIIIQLNVFLAVFNLLPIHPLDGFKIVEGILPHEKAREWKQLERYGIIFLLLMIFPFGGNTMIDSVVRPAADFILNLIMLLSGMRTL